MVGRPELTAVSGMTGAQNQIGTIANNVANSGTYGYKEELRLFTELVGGTGGSKGGASSSITSAIVRLTDNQGILTNTSNVGDLSVLGNGRMIIARYVNPPAGQPNEFAFVSTDSFYPDKDGYLKSAVNDWYLMGWPTDTAGKPTVAVLSTLSNLVPIQANKVANLSKETTNIDLQINLPADGDTTAATTIQAYDSLGLPHDLTFSWTKTASSPNTWDLEITCPDGPVTKNTGAGNNFGGATPMTVVFDGNGNPLSFDGAATPPDAYISWATGGANNSMIALNLGAVGTSTGLSCRGKAYTETNLTQDGKELGTFSQININEQGILSVSYTNGENLNLYMVPLANFANPFGLQAKSGNMWAQSNKSGPYILGQANTASFGTLQSFSLEESTVDIATQLTKMLRAQQQYSSNAQVVSTTGEMARVLDRIKS